MPKTARTIKSASTSSGEVLSKYLNATAGRPDPGLHDLCADFDQGLIGSEQFAKAVVMFTRLQDLLATLWATVESDRMRQCACGCGRWFFARKRGRQFHDKNCRRSAQVLTHAQKEHRRVYMRNYMKKYYAQNLSTWRAAGSNL